MPLFPTLTGPAPTLLHPAGGHERLVFLKITRHQQAICGPDLAALEQAQ